MTAARVLAAAFAAATCAALPLALATAAANPRPAGAAAGATAKPRAEALAAEVDALLAKGAVRPALERIPALTAAYERTYAADTLRLVDALNKLGAKLAQVDPATATAATAESLFIRALHLREAHFGTEHLDVAKSCNMLATFLGQQGRYDRATEYKERALAIRTKALGPSDPLVARTQHEFAVLDMLQGSYQDAKVHFAAALPIVDAQPIPDSTRLANFLNDLSELRRIEARYAEAESCLSRSLALGAKLFPPDDAWFAEPTNNLAGLYKDLGRYAEAEPLLERSWKLRAAAAQPDSAALATAALNFAELYRLQDRPQEAAGRYAEALRLARRAYGADHPELVWFLNQNAVYFAERGAPERAEPLYREALAVLQRAGGPASLAAQTTHDLADLLQSEHRYAAAESLYRRALATREELLGASHPDVALTLTGLGRCIHARDARRDDEALALLDRAAVILDATHAEPEARVEAYTTRAFVHADRGEIRAAVSAMAVALAQIEALRPLRGAGESSRVRFLARHAPDADAMVGWCLQLGDVPRAIEVVERSRARAFLDRVAAAGLDPLADTPPAARASLEERMSAARLHLGELQQRLANLLESSAGDPSERRRQIAALEKERDAAALELERAHDAVLGASSVWRAALATSGAGIAAAEIASHAPAGGCIVLFRIGATASYVFAIPRPPQPAAAWELRVPDDLAVAWGVAPGRLTAAALERILAGTGPASGAEIALAARLSHVRGIGRIAESDPKAPAATAGAGDLGGSLYDLWRLLFPDPLWRRVVRVPEVVVVPDGALCRLPFEALVVEAKDAQEAPRYWLDAGPVVRYALSGASLTATPGNAAGAESHRAAADAAGGLLSVSAPAYDPRGPFAALPATARETAAIRAAVAGLPMTVLQGAEATETNVRAALAGQRYIHLATHGVVDRRHNEMLAGLVLAPPPQPTRDTAADGWLQLFEISDLRLDCDLAVLSACETGGGAYVEGEGVYALSRGFLAAGAREVVASLWSVEDESTAALVGDFLGGVIAARRRGTDVDDARALRDAKRRIRSHAEWSAPFYWAPFVLTARE